MAKKKETIIDRAKDVLGLDTKQAEELVEVKTKPKTKKDNWEIRDRVYMLKKGKPLSYILKTNGIYYFDEEAGYERELKYAGNQRTCFVDEMKGDQQLEHVIFRSGLLHVPRNKTVLQKLLSLYHPHKDVIYYEYNKVQSASDELDWLEFEADALMAAKNLDIDLAEAVMRVEMGSEVSKMTSREIKRDLLVFAKKNPALFLELVSDDNVQLRNFGIKAVEANILNITPDNRSFIWASTGRKLMNVPFEEHPYSALAAWFKTDEGMEVYTNIEKRMNK